MANQMIEKIETDGAKAVWRMYQATNGVISGLPVLSADEDRITRTLTTKYCNSATGTAITDGLDVGITGDGTGEIRQRENLPVNIYVNNQLNGIFGTDGSLSMKSYKLPVLNIMPASPTANGTTGELRVTNSGIYYCINTNTWRKSLNTAFVSEIITGMTDAFQANANLSVNASVKYIWRFSAAGSIGVVESFHNNYRFGGDNVSSLLVGATVQTVTANTVFSFRLGGSVIEVRFGISDGATSFRVASGTITEMIVERISFSVNW